VSRSQALPGDLVFGPGHVGIYAGDGMMLDAPDFGLKVDLRGVYKTMTSYGRIPT
jgi:cell wall-associated NlpC family hydrolase